MKVDFRWRDLQKIGDTKFVKSMHMWIFVVPLLVKAFEYVEDEKLVFQIFNQQLPISTSLPFSWSMFYFSALFLALGNLIYLYKCPKIIKEHPNYQSYVTEGKKLNQLEAYCNDISFDFPGLVKELKAKKERIQLNRRSSVQHLMKSEPDFDVEDPVYYFWPIHEFGDVKFLSYRRICTVLFIVGFTLFGIVALQNLWAVISFLITKT